jgi:C4-dicarboxylate-specific signal transduction histidine kinase
MGEALIGARSVRVAVVRDVTARKQAEALIEAREAELAEAARLTTTGEMAAALAHELNQPLTSLIGFVRACQALLQSPAGGGEAARGKASELIERAVQQAMRAGDIIRGAREFFRRGDMRRERIEAAETFRAVQELARAHAVQRRVKLAFSAPDGLPPLLIEPVQVQQALLNLVRNAVEAIALADSPRREVETTARPAPDDASFVEIAVRDTGPGFAPEAASRLFTPFMTTTETGMGLGLAIARSIVEAHGGRIWLASGGAGGAEIRFTLPIWSEEADAG